MKLQNLFIFLKEHHINHLSLGKVQDNMRKQDVTIFCSFSVRLDSLINTNLIQMLYFCSCQRITLISSVCVRHSASS